MQANPTPDGTVNSDPNPLHVTGKLWRDLRPTDERGKQVRDLLLHCEHKTFMHTIAVVRDLTWEMMSDDLRHHEPCSDERAAAVESTARWIIAELRMLPSCGYVHTFDRWVADRRDRPSMLDLSTCPDYDAWMTERADASREAFDLESCVREELESVTRVTAAAWALHAYGAEIPAIVRGEGHAPEGRLSALRIGVLAALRSMATGSELIRCVHMSLALHALHAGTPLAVTPEQVVKTMELVKGEFGEALRPEVRQ